MIKRYMKIDYKPRESKQRTFNKMVKKEFHQLQIDKLPNEFRKCFDNYNSNSVGGDLQIDENDYR
ncbi:hypothetical protein UFOVP100_39 [uncultured Caudovirales phage]|uniref:Uncharacterized protein n=1 Tax=uncultured Caudovirales phage TaxID=2100421 RepID=A0A6J5L2D6_9CAUD|nr:hypothetical protein UFOVP100_39 [uncultured Caudovirales phage]